jgi:putative membrane protein
MVLYNPKDWWRLIFTFHKSDTFRRTFPGIIGVAIYTGLINYLEKEILAVEFTNTLNIHSLVGFVLSLLLVFRTNSAYERWWEGRKIWGSFVNNSRNLALKIDALITDQKVKTTFSILISNYILAAKDHLQDKADYKLLRETEKYPLAYYSKFKHLPNAIAKAMYKEIQELRNAGVLSDEQLLYLNLELKSFTDNIGACERIKKTPIPFSYNIFIKKVIFLYVFTMPIGFVQTFDYWAMPIVALVFYIFSSIELIAEEIEDPFGEDANDLPINDIYLNIKGNVTEILE